MKIKVSKNLLIENLQKVQSVVSTRTTIPILSNVLLKVEKNKLWLTATDLEVSVRTALDVQVIKEGAGTIPARRLFSIIRELSGTEIEIEMDDKNTASIRCGSSFFKVLGLAEEEFPPLPKFEAAKTFTVDQGIFKAMLQNTSYAISNDEARYVLNGVLMSFKGDKLTMVATDGRRLAMYEQELEFPKESEAELILPFKTTEELKATLQNEGSLKINATQNQISFELGDMTIISKLVDGTFPNYRLVIPAQSEQRIKIDREEFNAAIRRVALMADDKTSSVKLSFGKNKLELVMENREVGEARETVAIDYNGKTINAAYNPDFLMAPLKHLVSDEIVMELTDDLSPAVIKANIPFLYVIMPVRVN